MMTMTNLSWYKSASRHGRVPAGASALEVAAVLPLVVILVIGTLDLGLAVYAYNTVSESARAGARYAIAHGSDTPSPVGPSANNATVASVVRSYSPGLISNDLTITSTWPDGSNAPGSRVTVTANYTYRPVLGWIVGRSTLPVTGTTTMMIPNWTFAANSGDNDD